MNAEATCPRCGKPRFEDSLDCPYCGVVYDRYEARATTSETASETMHSAEPGESHEEIFTPIDGGQMYDGPEVVGSLEPGPGSGPPPPPGAPSPAPGRFVMRASTSEEPKPLEGSRISALLMRDLPTSIVVVGAVFVILQIYMTTSLISFTTDADRVQARFLSMTGVTPPEELIAGAHFRFVGRDFLWLAAPMSRGMPTTTLIFRRKTLGGWVSGDELRTQLEGWMRRLDLSWQEGRTTRARVGAEIAEVQLIDIGEPQQTVGRAALASFEHRERPLLLVVAGDDQGYDELRGRIFRRAR